MPVIVLNLDDNDAIIQLVDSNIQRENILPSERARAYKLRVEAIKRKAGRPTKEQEKNPPNYSAVPLVRLKGSVVIPFTIFVIVS